MRPMVAVCMFLALLTGRMMAQTPGACAAGDRPAFDIVSIKPSDSPVISWMRRTPDGLTMTAPLHIVIQFAFSLHDFQVTGGPGWLKTTNWEIHAKNDDPTELSQLNDSQRQAIYDKNMQQLQSMLMGRFHLQCHTTSREMPVYELVIAKRGAKLKESQAPAGQRGNILSNDRGVTAHTSGTAVGTGRLATVLAGPTGRVVIDKTGLAGSYDFTLDWVNDPPAGPQAQSDAPSGPTIYTAVEEQLGLKLVPARGQVPVLVVDGVEQPSQN
jgi:bla regulator protein blaR1